MSVIYLKRIVYLDGVFKWLQFHGGGTNQHVRSKESSKTTQWVCVTWPQMTKWTASIVHVRMAGGVFMVYISRFSLFSICLFDLHFDIK